MITQEQFTKIEYEHGCGYWNLCWDHACPCAITVEHKGLRQDIWDSMVKENKEIVEEYEKEFGNKDYKEDYYEVELDDDLDWEYEYEEEE